MSRKYVPRFERMPVYKDAFAFYSIARRISEALPPQHRDIRDMINCHSTTIGLKIARGTAELTRADAYRAFRISQRAAELCHSILERLRLAQLAAEPDVSDAIALLERVDAALQRIAGRIKSNLSPRDVFAD